MQFAAYLVRIRMMQFIKDMQGKLPGPAGRCCVADRLLGIPKVYKVFSLAKALAQFPGNLKSALIATNAFRMAAELILYITEGIPLLGFPSGIVQLAVHDKSSPARGAGSLIVAYLSVDPADIIERGGLPGGTLHGAVKSQSLLSVYSTSESRFWWLATYERIM